MFPIPTFPPPPAPPSPTALDRCDSRGYDRTVARAKYLLGILAPWISLPRAWMQQGLEGGNVWGSGSVSHWNASLANVTTFPGDSSRTEIDRVTLKIWCTDKCLMPTALIAGASFPSTLEGHHISTVFTSCGWWRAKLFPVRDSHWPGQAKEHSKRLVSQDTVVGWGLETHFLPRLFI